MDDFDYQKIDDVIHSRIRTAIMALLVSVDEAEFIYIRDKVNTTDGNLSVHLRKLEDSHYVSVTKKFVNRKPTSIYKITTKGRSAFEEYIKMLESKKKKKN